MDEASTSARSAIEATIRDYVEGWYEGDAARMDRALHDDLAKRALMMPSDGSSGDLQAVSKERMVSVTESGGGEAPGAAYEIAIDHVSGRVASARVLSLEYLDYLHLVEVDGAWKIANILFRTRD